MQRKDSSVARNVGTLNSASAYQETLVRYFRQNLAVSVERQVLNIGER